MGFENSRLQLEKNDFKDEPDRREHIKLLLNSSLGKFNQTSQNVSTKFIRSAGEMDNLFQNHAEDIIDFIDINSTVCQVNLRSNFPSKNRRTNPIILAFITAKTRIFLHQQIVKLTKANMLPYYTDTDSILFTAKTNVRPPLEFGLGFGNFKHELGEKSTIKKFHAYGRKNFFIAYENEHSKKESLLTKIAGMTLNSQLAKGEFKKLVVEKNPKLAQIRNVFKQQLRMTIPVVQRVTLNNVEYRCERKVDKNSDNLITKPWGY